MAKRSVEHLSTIRDSIWEQPNLCFNQILCVRYRHRALYVWLSVGPPNCVR